MLYELWKNVKTGQPCVAVKRGETTVPLLPLLVYDRAHAGACKLTEQQLCDCVALLADWQVAVRETEYLLRFVGEVPVRMEDYQTGLLPFEPKSYRDFMLYEQHVINSAKGFVREFMPNSQGIVKAYEALLKRPFPRLLPKKLWYQKPIFYTGNHLAFVPSGSEIVWPPYSNYVDYELELGVLITKPLYNCTLAQAKEAIGGFVLFNDCSARDVQLPEMDSGFGPSKSKNFASVMGAIVATPDEIWPVFDSIVARVWIDGIPSGTGSLTGARYNLEEAVAYAAEGEHLYPGELLGSGTIPGCSGIESNHHVQFGSEIRMELGKLGVLTTKIAK